MNIFKRKQKITGENIMQIPEQSHVEVLNRKFSGDEVYQAILEQVISNQEILITSVKNGTSEAHLSERAKYDVTIKTYKGLFENSAQVTEKIFDGGIFYYRLKFLEGTKKIQRRESYRLERKIKFNFGFVDKVSEDILRKDIPLEESGETHNISVGGVRFFSNTEIEENSLIKILANIEGMIVVAICRVLYKDESEEDRYQFAYKCKFELMPDRYTEMLSKYIFEKQRELSKSGKI